MRAEIAIIAATLMLASSMLRSEEAKLPATGNWIISETTSPLDYSPIVAAINRPGDGSVDAMQLSLHCRNGRTSLSVGGPKLSGKGYEFILSYSVNGSAPVIAGTGLQTSTNDVVLQGDTERLLRSIPDEGTLLVRLVPRSGPTVESSFALKGLQVVRTKLAAACR